jgi:hypothetical protein
MSILVDKNKTFTLSFNGSFKTDNSNNIIGFKINDGDVLLKAHVTGRDFESMSKVIEECSIINSVTGKPLLRSSLLCKLILLNYFKKIEIESKEENSVIVINKDSVNKIHYDIVKFLAMKWLEFTDGA